MPLAAVGAMALLAGFVSVAPAAAQQPQLVKLRRAARRQPRIIRIGRNTISLARLRRPRDPKARLEVLNTWQDKYPQTDYAQERLQYYVVTLSQLAPNDPTQRQPLLTNVRSC